MSISAHQIEILFGTILLVFHIEISFWAAISSGVGHTIGPVVSEFNIYFDSSHCKVICRLGIFRDSIFDMLFGRGGKTVHLLVWYLLD